MEALSPPPRGYLHHKTPKSTLKLTKVEVVEMVKMLSRCIYQRYTKFQLTIVNLSVCVRFNGLSSIHHDCAAEKAIFLSREDKGESEKLSSSSPSSSLIAAHPSSLPPSPSQRTSALAPNAAAPPLPIEVLPVTKGKRPSKIELAATLRKIRHLLAEGYTNKEIIEMLQLEERTFYRYMARIYEQDKAYFEQQDNESIATEIILAKERTLKSLRRLDAMAADENLSPAERLEAERYRNDVVILLAKIEVEGPRIVHDTFRRLYEH